MENYAGLFNIHTKNIANRLRTLVNATIILFLVTAISYFTYYVLNFADEIVEEYLGRFFIPLASFLNPNVETDTAILKTGFELLLGIPLCALFYYIIDNIEEKIIKLNYKIHEKNVAKLEKKKQQTMIVENEITNKNFVICLSLDIKSTNKIKKEDTRNKLCAMILLELRNRITQHKKTIFKNKEKAILTISSEIIDYDNAYSTLLKEMSEIKSEFNKYNVHISPIITAELYDEENNINNILRKHIQVKEINLKNKNVATNNFVKEYKKIKNSEYMTVPIGEYICSNSKIIELNSINIR